MSQRKRVKVDNEPQTMTLESLEELLKNDQKVKVAGTDVDGVLRGKIMLKSKFLSAVKAKGFGFCGVIFGWDLHDNTYDHHVTTGIGNDYADVMGAIDVNSFRRVPWQDNLPFFLMDFVEKTGVPREMCPRSLLKKAIADLAADGLVGMCGVEYEFFNFRETPISIEEKKFRDLNALTYGQFGYSILRQAQNPGYFNDIFDQLALYGIPIEGLHTETGPGVYEAAIEYSEALLAADRGQMFKTCVKEIGLKHGVMPSFMAKPYVDQPGCGGHTHVSLWDAEGKENLFWDESDPYHMSLLCKQFLAGVLHCLPYVLPMYCPNINSYKRIVEKMWAPVVVSWGVENRTSAVRLINDNKKAIRLEVRVCGADMNCYLSVAAILASGLYGIRNKLQLQPESTGDNLQDKSLVRLSKDLNAAADKMLEKDSVARKIFGDVFTEHYANTRKFEYLQFTQAVTDWELRRYFELI